MKIVTQKLLTLILAQWKPISLLFLIYNIVSLKVYASEDVIRVIGTEEAIAAEKALVQTTGLISNISSTTGKSYALASLAVGVRPYTDRTYQVTSVPSSLSGASLVQTANDDKRYAGATLLTFTLSQSATVYVAYDPRATALPAWLSGWQKLTDRVGVNDSKISHMELYSKTFPAGQVSLGGNLQSPAAGAENNYFMVAKQVTSTASGLISNISTTTGKSYTQAELSVGVRPYTDRTYQLTSVPASLSGASLVQTANDDKRYAGATLLTFTLSQSATVYVAYDPRATALPTWLSGWQKLTDRIGVNDSKISHMELYSKAFPAGQVTLGGNLQSPAAGAENNYFVVARPAEAGPYTLAVSTTGSGTVSKSPNQASYAPGTSVSLTATAASGYRFSGWGGDATGTANPLSVTMDGNKAVTATFAQVQTTGLISNISSTTGKSYALSSLAVGVRPYTDRTYQVTSVPSSLSGASLVQTANDDKRYAGATLLTFTLSQSATVYVAYDPRATALPAWLSGWQKLTDRIGVNDAVISHMELYSKTFAAGTVSLGGNLQSPAAGAENNYFVVAKESVGSEDDTISPSVAVQLNGVLQSPGVYSNEVTVTVQASDEGGSGLASVQYSLNNGAYTTYSAPFKISSVGSYTIRGRATDGKGNQTTTDAISFSVARPAQSNAYLVLESADKFPANDQLTFSLIQNPWRRMNEDSTYTPYNANHNRVRLRMHNKGTGTLIINNLSVSNTSIWKIAQLNGAAYNASTALPITINSKGYVDVLLEFIAKDQATRVKLVEGALTISSNDDLSPTKEVKLRGIWQRNGEGSYEPNAQEILNAFGFRSRTGFSGNDGASDGRYIIPNSDEILSAYFLRADPSRPVEVIQMAAYHGCCSTTETFQWYDKGSTAYKTLFTHNALDGQSLLPRKSGSTTALAQGTFSPTATSANPTAAFGFKIQRSFSDRTRNFEGGIAIRIWKAIDGNGNIIPNAYLIGMDYLGTEFTNFDYQDNIYFIRNIKPETGPSYSSELAATPSAVDFGAVLVGSSKSLTVNLKNLGNTYDSGSDPAIQISRVEVAGPNSSEFSGPTLSTTLATQASTDITVSFRPGSLGIKNAALLVYYNNASSPLRIPLYGIANINNTTIAAVKRVKSGSDESRTIAGNAWEADINYRKGSIKLDRQVVAGPIASTDDDVLYQTYLSAATDLAETRYEIPISNGSYMVRMHFVENFFSTDGARIFNISIENQLRLNGFEIYREAGYRAALVKDFEVNVADGILDIKFNPTANRVAIAGVEIYKASSSAGATISSNLQIADEETSWKLNAYPNPNAGDKVFVVAENFKGGEKIKLTLYDALGKEIKSINTVADTMGAISVELALDKRINRGLYLIKTESLTGRRQARIVVE